MNNDLYEQIEKVRQEKEEHRKITNLVDGLLFSFSIDPSGRNLVWYLGEGTERNNRTVIHDWVKKEINKPQFDSDEKGILSSLCYLLGQTLEEMEERQWV